MYCTPWASRLGRWRFDHLCLVLDAAAEMAAHKQDDFGSGVVAGYCCFRIAGIELKPVAVPAAQQEGGVNGPIDIDQL